MLLAHTIQMRETTRMLFCFILTILLVGSMGLLGLLVGITIFVVGGLIIFAIMYKDEEEG